MKPYLALIRNEPALLFPGGLTTGRDPQLRLEIRDDVHLSRPTLEDVSIELTGKKLHE